MPSDQVDEVLTAFKTLDERVEAVGIEAGRLTALRGDIKGAVDGIASCSLALKSVAAELARGAATMRELDMAATLARIGEIEKAFERRSDELGVVLDRSMVALGDSLLAQLSARLDTRLGEVVPAACATQSKVLSDRIAAVDDLGQQRHAEGLARFQSLYELCERHHGLLLAATEVVGGQLDTLSPVLESTKKEAQTACQAIAQLTQHRLDPMAKTLATVQTQHAEVAKTLGESIQPELSRLSRRTTMTIVAAAAAAIAAIAATVMLLVR